jgi:hypothetical protein
VRSKRGRLVVVSYQLPVRLTKIERKDTDSDEKKKVANEMPRTLAAFSSGKVKFDPNDIDIGEDSDNEENIAAKKQQQKQRGALGGLSGLSGLSGGSLSGGKKSLTAAGGNAREPRYTVQWDDARNFLSNLRIMQAQYAENANAANAAAIAEGKAQAYYPSDVQWVGVPNIQTEDKTEMDEITQLLEKCTSFRNTPL